MPAPARLALALLTGLLVVGAMVLTVPSREQRSEQVQPLPPAGASTLGSGAVTPEAEAVFARVREQVREALLAEQPLHLERAAREGVFLTEAHYRRALQALDRFELLSDEAWQEKMQGVWAKCAAGDACTAPLLVRGRVARTLTYVRATAVPGAPDRLVTEGQLAELLEHEVAHVLLMLAGYSGNQDAFITERWTLGAPDSALAVGRERCAGSYC